MRGEGGWLSDAVEGRVGWNGRVRRERGQVWVRGQSAGEADLREHALFIWRVYMYGLNVLQLLTHGCVFAVTRI